MATGDPPPGHPPHEVDDKQTLNPPQPWPQATDNSFSNFDKFSNHRIHVDASHLQPTYLQVAQGSNRSTDAPTSQEQHSDLDFEDIPLKPISMYLGKPSVVFSLSEKISLIDKLQFVLVGKFSHGMPPLNHIRRFFSSLKLHKSCNITLFDKKHIFIECFCKADYIFIWLHLSWIIEGFKMRVLKWSAEFSPRNESATVPVWIRLEGLPLYMFDERSLLAIGNCIGKPIKVDPRNVDRSIVHSARICVELDVSKPLLDSLWVSFEDDVTKVVMEGFMVKVRFEEVPPYCGFCYHIGHGYSTCKRREESGVQEIGVVQERQVLGGSKNIQTAGHLGSETGIHMDTNSSNRGAQHMAVLIANGSFQHIDTYGKGMNQIEGMLVKTFIQTPQPGLYHRKQTHDGKQTKKEQHGTAAKGDVAAILEQKIDALNQHVTELVCLEGVTSKGQLFGEHSITGPLMVPVADAQQTATGVASASAGTTTKGRLLGEKSAAEFAEQPAAAATAEMAGQHDVATQEPVAACVAEAASELAGQQPTEEAFQEVHKNSFATLEEEVLVEDIALEEGELVEQHVNATDRLDSGGVRSKNEGVLEGANVEHNQTPSGQKETTAANATKEVTPTANAVIPAAVLTTAAAVIAPYSGSNEEAVADGDTAEGVEASTVFVAESPYTVAEITKAGGHSWADLVEKEEKQAGSNTQSWADLAKEEQIQHLATYAIEEIEMIMATPTSTYSISEETVPNTCNASILDLEGSPVPCSEIIRNSARIADVRKHFQFLSNEKFVETLVEQGKYEEVIKEAMIKYTKEIRRTFLDHAKSIYPKDSTTEKDTSQTQEATPKVSTVDEKEWSTPKRRGKNRNRSK